MSEKYILMGRGIPSIIPNDQTTPGTRLTATEARQYARRLVELADKLTPANPPPVAQPDDDALDVARKGWIGVRTWTSRQSAYFLEIDGYIAALEQRLDAATKRAERAETVLIPFASVADSFNIQEGNKPLWANYPSLRIEHFRDAVRVVRGLDDPKESPNG